MIFNGVVTVIDFIWLITIWGIWTQDLPDNDAWNSFLYLHYMVLFLSVLNVFVKVAQDQPYHAIV